MATQKSITMHLEQGYLEACIPLILQYTICTYSQNWRLLTNTAILHSLAFARHRWTVAWWKLATIFALYAALVYSSASMVSLGLHLLCMIAFEKPSTFTLCDRLINS